MLPWHCPPAWSWSALRQEWCPWRNILHIKSCGETLQGFDGIQQSPVLFSATGWKDSDLAVDPQYAVHRADMTRATGFVKGFPMSQTLLELAKDFVLAQMQVQVLSIDEMRNV